MKFYLFLLIFCSSLQLFSQEIERDVISNAGQFNANGITVDFTIGELASSYHLDTDFHVTEGFQQGEFKSVIVPVELLSFAAKRLSDEKAKLNWTTASETNNKGFFLERRNEDETEFREITFIEGNDNSSELIDYIFLDDNDEIQNTYYRLKQMDLDESFTYSEVRIVGPVEVKATAVVAPNPVTSEMSLNIISNLENGDAKVIIYNLQGKEIEEYRFEEIRTNEPFSIPLDDTLPQGIYLLNIYYAEQQLQSLKFIKL